MKKIKNILLVTAVACSVMSCEVERLPYDAVDSSVALTDPDYAHNALIGIYGNLKGTLSNSWANNAHRLMEYNGDNVSLSGTTGDDLFYMYNYRHIDNGGRINDFWIKSYKVIYGANSAIENIKEGTNKENDNSLGEAYFLRSVMYLYLTNVFGRPYNQSPDTNLSVPLKLDTNIDNQPPRATVKEAFAQIEKDLLKAAELMTINKPAFYANREAAYALLSRLYLYMENNDKAVEYANKVISSGRYQLLNADQFRKMNTFLPENNSEAIFSVKYLTGLEEGSQNDVVGGFYSTIDGQGWGEMYASRSLLDETYYFPNDARQAFFDPQYQDGADKEGLWVEHINADDGTSIPTYKAGEIKGDEGNLTLVTENGDVKIKEVMSPTGVKQYFFAKGGKEYQVYVDRKMRKRGKYPLYYITKCSLQEEKIHAWSPSVIRYAEVLLNKAEALYKLNRSAEAIQVLNELRSHRDCPAYTGDTISGRGNTDLLDVILDERRVELAFEGHRALDLFRNKRNLDRDYPGSHLVNKDSYKEIKWTDKNIVELIPLAQINAQENLVQNEL